MGELHFFSGSLCSSIKIEHLKTRSNPAPLSRLVADVQLRLNLRLCSVMVPMTQRWCSSLRRVG